MTNHLSELYDPVLRTMMSSGLSGVPSDPHMSQEMQSAQRAMEALFVALAPRDAAEAMLVDEIVAAHTASMDCLRLAALPHESHASTERLHKQARSMARMSDNALRRLLRRQRVANVASPAPAGRTSGKAPAPQTPVEPQRRQHQPRLMRGETSADARVITLVPRR